MKSQGQVELDLQGLWLMVEEEKKEEEEGEGAMYALAS